MHGLTIGVEKVTKLHKKIMVTLLKVCKWLREARRPLKSPLEQHTLKVSSETTSYQSLNIESH